MRSIMNRSTAAKRKIVAFVLCALMLVNIFTAAVEENPAIISVNYDGTEYSYATLASTVEEFLSIEGIQIKANDYMSHAKTAPIEDGMKIVVNVAKYVTVHDDGVTSGAITYQTTVEGVLEEFGAPLEGNDSSWPSAEESIYDGIEINVSRAKLITFTRGGTTLQYYTYNRTVEEFLDEVGVSCDSDEKVVPSSTAALYDGMTVAIKPKVDAMSTMDFGLDLSQAKRVITCEATAYTSAADECGKSDGITASGMMFRVGVVAVDRRQIPLGTKLYIESLDGKYVYGYCIAADTGGAIKGNKVDLAMNTKGECFQFGRRQVRVYIF
ncbi:MAG: DUF348 domain-containing protein [Clostridia bacterium]|nr:DUF348 domain-containing protein [Clostridia bacterium]